MAPTQSRIEEQTSLIVQCLLDDDDTAVKFRHQDSIEPDGPADADSGDDFDPVLIAHQLKRIAETFQNDAAFKAVLTDFGNEMAKEVLETKFAAAVDALCQADMGQMAEAAPEMQLIKATVSLGLHIKKNWPQTTAYVQGAMTAFLSQRVGIWLGQRGGWRAMRDFV